MSRLADIKEFYLLLDELSKLWSGTRRLNDCTGRDDWPLRGVYFFFEDGEYRGESGGGLRITRIGTHAVYRDSNSSLWNRLRQHRGTRDRGGNHRGSVFRLWVGDALSQKHPDLRLDSWLDVHAPRSRVKGPEHSLECKVSDYIGKMPFVCVDVDDMAGMESMRAYIERNSIALLSNLRKNIPVDPASTEWLGAHSSSLEIKRSGLWNSHYVDKDYDRGFLQVLEHYVRRICKR